MNDDWTQVGEPRLFLWASVSLSVRWDIVYGLPHGSYDGQCDSSCASKLETLPAVSAQVGACGCQSPELTSDWFALSQRQYELLESNLVVIVMKAAFFMY